MKNKITNLEAQVAQLELEKIEQAKDITSLKKRIDDFHKSTPKRNKANWKTS